VSEDFFPSSRVHRRRGRGCSCGRDGIRPAGHGSPGSSTSDDQRRTATAATAIATGADLIVIGRPLTQAADPEAALAALALELA